MTTTQWTDARTPPPLGAFCLLRIIDSSDDYPTISYGTAFWMQDEHNADCRWSPSDLYWIDTEYDLPAAFDERSALPVTWHVTHWMQIEYLDIRPEDELLYRLKREQLELRRQLISETAAIEKLRREEQLNDPIAELDEYQDEFDY